MQLRLFFYSRRKTTIIIIIIIIIRNQYQPQNSHTGLAVTLRGLSDVMNKTQSTAVLFYIYHVVAAAET